MRCEVCGRTFQDQPRRAIVEGAKLLVCPTCARHASADWEEPKQPKQQIRAQGRIYGQTSRKPVGTRKSLDTTLEEYVLVEDYGAIVRQIREKLRWSQEDLGRKINAKSSLIAKIETKKITPDEPTIKQLEHVLGINLQSPITTDTQLEKASKAATDLTLGDVVVMKKRERRPSEPASDLG
ncbi:MAG: multiprotein bridging factor aMBF1 [Candidatus Bathyarchaeia archaeon]